MEKILKRAIQIAMIDFVLIVGVIIYFNVRQVKQTTLQNNQTKLTQKSIAAVKNNSSNVVVKQSSNLSPTIVNDSSNNVSTQSTDQPTDTPVTNQTDNSPAPTAAPTTVDLFAQVPQHNNQGDCWMIIAGHIYNITSFFGSHPGGDAVMLKYCGQDATSGFNTKDKNPGSAHSAAAISMLQQYLIQ